MRSTLPPTIFLIAIAALVGCSRSDSSAATSDSAAATASTTSSATADQPKPTNVRGTLSSITDTVLVVSTRTGDVRVAVAEPLQVYSRVPATLSQVKETSFVGVTSVPQPDGSQRATEIHIFPDALRGMGEGSRLMGQPGGAPGGSQNTMTNGTVTASKPTEASGSSRMTNGTISGQPGGTLTVQYQGGTQTISVPPDVTVTAIAPTKTKLATGMNVVVLTATEPDGTLKATAVMLSGSPGRKN